MGRRNRDPTLFLIAISRFRPYCRYGEPIFAKVSEGLGRLLREDHMKMRVDLKGALEV